MMCQQCGNEFYNGKRVKKDEKEFIQCPYCGYLHNRHNNNKKKNRRGKRP